MILKLVRWIMSRVILFLDAVIPVKPLPPTREQKEQIDRVTAAWIIYEFRGCPFCVKVRRGFKRRGIGVEYRDAKQEIYKNELLKGGGKVQVPCLRTPDQWLYESQDILNYAETQLVSKN